jgi:ElaB/YqjD/DUF883 family membrane-anchored ribosome-binding protein
MNDERCQSEVIKDDIDRTLYEMDQTVCELQRRVSVRSLVDKVAGAVSQPAVAGRMAQSVKDNPVPSALIGLGLVFLAVDRFSGRGRNAGEGPRTRGRTKGHDFKEDGSVNDRTRRGEDYAKDKLGDTGGRLTNAASDVGHKASDIMDTAKDKVSHAADSISDATHSARQNLSRAGRRAMDTVSDAAHAVGYRVRHARQDAEHMYNDNPLAFGAAAVAVGLVGGLLLPSTRAEDRLMGDVRDDILGAAKRIGHDAVERGKNLVHDIAETAQENPD